MIDRLREFGLVYLGTPYSKYPAGIERAFRDAASLAGKLLTVGVKSYSPIAHTHPIAIHGQLDPYDHAIWLPFDAAIMDKSDAMIVAMMDGWDVSYGIKHEIEEFTKAGKPIFYLDPNSMEISETADVAQ